MIVQYLSRKEYDENVERNPGGHWDNADSRWIYHARAIEFIKLLNPSSPGDVLEMGTMGASLVHGSDTIDYNPNWPVKNFVPTIFHDARSVPWPIPDKKYLVFIALRVFQHLVPNQRECFLEAKRIAKNVVIVVPESYPEQILNGLKAGGISKEAFIEWNDEVPPATCVKLGGWLGNLYFWNEASFQRPFFASQDHLNRARRLIMAYEAARAKGEDTCEFEGRTIDHAAFQRAQGLLVRNIE